MNPARGCLPLLYDKAVFLPVPSISVITVNRNNASGLRETIASVLEQDDPDFEYIVVDGASTDGSAEILATTPGISSWVSEPDTGIYEAMNKGIARANGDYLLFINSGDSLAGPTTLSGAKPHLTADIVYGNMRIESANGDWDGFMPDAIDMRQMMLDTLWHPVSFIRRDLFERYGTYDTSFRICGDYDWFFNVIVNKHATTRHIDQFIAVFDLNGISSRPENVRLVASEKQRAQRKWLTDRQVEDFWAAERRSARAARVRRAARRLLARVVSPLRVWSSSGGG